MGDIRRNFVHNVIVHRACGWVWFCADVWGLAGYPGLKDTLLLWGEHIHETDCSEHKGCVALVAVGLVMDAAVTFGVVTLFAALARKLI